MTIFIEDINVDDNVNDNVNVINPFEYISFDNGTRFHYQIVIDMLREKNVVYRSFHQNYPLDNIDNMNNKESRQISKICRNINFIGIVCEMLADEISDNEGQHECEPNTLHELLFTTFDRSMSLDDLLEMSQQQVNSAPDLF